VHGLVNVVTSLSWFVHKPPLYNSQAKATNTVTMDTFESKFPASSFILPLSPNLCYKLVNLMFSTSPPRWLLCHWPTATFHQGVSQLALRRVGRLVIANTSVM